jgi:isocitrate/isopropylmalate dehydrogenase
MLLDWLGRRQNSQPLARAAAVITAAVRSALDDPGTRTRDVGGQLGTAEFAAAVSALVGSAPLP